jgi:hypothetical protein
VSEFPPGKEQGIDLQPKLNESTAQMVALDLFVSDI